MTSYKNQEHQGWCGRCRTVWQWVGVPTQQDAECPAQGCGLPLARVPHVTSRGRHRLQNRTPLARQKPTLVIREVEYEKDTA